MKSLLLLVFIPALAAAQNPPDVLKQGEEVFSRTCATSYCHGPAGASGGAPRIAARGFDFVFINNVVTRGIPNSAMSSFANTLSRAELTAVVAYVARLNGVASPAVAAGGARENSALSTAASRGRELFYDAVRGFARCSTCHEVNGIGIPVATPIAKVPSDVAALKSMATPRVATATMAGESMPVLLLSNKSQAVMYYDLTVPPPVLRTDLPAAVQIRDGSTWRHSSVIGSYSDAELDLILEYLRAVVRP